MHIRKQLICVVWAVLTFNFMSWPSVAGASFSADDSEATALTLPANTKVYVAPMTGGFENYIIAGLRAKKVPLTVVIDRDKAAYEISGVPRSKKQVDIEISNSKSGSIILGYSVDITDSVHAGEEIARHLRTEGAKYSLPPKIPKAAKIFVTPISDGFDIYLRQAIADSNVPVEVVQSRDLAEFEIAGTFEDQRQGLAGKLMGETEQMEVSIHLSDLKSSEVEWSFAGRIQRTLPHEEKRFAAWCAGELKRTGVEK